MYNNFKDPVEYLKKLVGNTKDISREKIELFITPFFPLFESAPKNVDRAYVKLGARICAGKYEGQALHRRNFAAYAKRVRVWIL